MFKDVETPLDRYVNAPDPSFRYEILDVYDEVDCTLVIVNLTSQRWTNSKYITNTHQLY